jgi:hypothetical protein
MSNHRAALLFLAVFVALASSIAFAERIRLQDLETGATLTSSQQSQLRTQLGITSSGSPCDAYPVGAIYISTNSTNPATSLGCGTWSAFGAGRTLVALNSGDADFDTDEETGGAKTKAISAHSGTAVASHASHTHTYSQVLNHTHTVTVTDPGHTHPVTSQTATTGSASSYEHGAIDTSSAEAQEGEATASSTTGITATTANPAGGVASGTTDGPSATLTHSVTQPDSHTDLNVVQPYIVVRFWKRTA